MTTDYEPENTSPGVAGYCLVCGQGVYENAEDGECCCPDHNASVVTWEEYLLCQATNQLIADRNLIAFTLRTTYGDGYDVDSDPAIAPIDRVLELAGKGAIL